MPDLGPQPTWDSLIPEVNRLLGPLEERLRATATTSWPVIHVVGPPRSGTTLALQLLIDTLEIGYIDNVSAAFGGAPTVGVALSRHLLGDRRGSSFASNYGKTDGPAEPHEFGYFWLDLLGYRSMTFGDRGPEPIDFDRVRGAMLSIAAAWGRPIAVKTFIGGWHLQEFKAVMPNTLVVRLHRDPVDTAESILRLREARHGTQDRWVSLRPQTPFDPLTLTPPEQVSAQVIWTEKALDEQLRAFDLDDVLDISYEHLVDDPGQLTRGVSRMLAQKGFAVASRDDQPGPFQRSRPKGDGRDRKLIAEALARLTS